MISNLGKSVHHGGKLVARLSTRKGVVMLKPRCTSSSWQRSFRRGRHGLLLDVLVEEFFKMARHFNRFRGGAEITLLFVFHHSGLINASAFNLSTAAKFLVTLCTTSALFFLRLVCLAGKADMLFVVLGGLVFKLLAFLQKTGNLCFDLGKVTVGVGFALIVVPSRSSQVVPLLLPACPFLLGLLQFVCRYLSHIFNLGYDFRLFDFGLLHALFKLANLLPLSFIIASVRRETAVKAVDFLLQIGQGIFVVSLVAFDTISLSFELLFRGLNRILEGRLGRQWT